MSVCARLSNPKVRQHHPKEITLTQSEAAKALQSSLYRSLPIYEHIEAQVEELGDRVKCSVPLKAKNQNHFGAVHAALQFAVCEMTGALAVSQQPAIRDGGYHLVVKNLSIDFLKPAMTDVTATAFITEAQRIQLMQTLESKGKAELALDIELTDLENRLVAKAVGQYHISVKRTES